MAFASAYSLNFSVWEPNVAPVKMRHWFISEFCPSVLNKLPRLFVVLANYNSEVGATVPKPKLPFANSVAFWVPLVLKFMSWLPWCSIRSGKPCTEFQPTKLVAKPLFPSTDTWAMVVFIRLDKATKLINNVLFFSSFLILNV